MLEYADDFVTLRQTSFASSSLGTWFFRDFPIMLPVFEMKT